MKRTLTSRQQVAGSVLILASSLAGVIAPQVIVMAWAASFTGLFLAVTTLKLYYYWRGSKPAREAAGAEIGSEQLPRYSLLIPLYREANVVPRLFTALEALDYPANRLEVLLLVEHDDPETMLACELHRRPSWRLLRVPPGSPRTKPRALNMGLGHVTGEFFTIYDAEDRPDRDQLLKAVSRFRALPSTVAALQARLDFYNESQNLLTRWFTCEYATHFGFHTEGIARCGHAMPLGGTSTHFRTETVRAVGSWDAWNVTEDCELGMRLAAAGYESLTLDSTTWEEAVPRVPNWIRQRSRWIKGFAQTGLALLRFPVATARAMGARRYLAALITVAGVPVVLMSQIVFWAVLWLYVGLSAAHADVSAIEAVFPEPFRTIGTASLVAGNLAVLVAHVGAVYQRGRYHLMRYALFMPIYTMLASLAAWRGVAQLFGRPHYWEKTQHGFAVEPLRLAQVRHVEAETVPAMSAAGAD